MKAKEPRVPARSGSDVGLGDSSLPHITEHGIGFLWEFDVRYIPGSSDCFVGGKAARFDEVLDRKLRSGRRGFMERRSGEEAIDGGGEGGGPGRKAGSKGFAKEEHGIPFGSDRKSVV